MEADRSGDRIRLAELMAALSLATDLGRGQPLGRALGVCLSALELASRLGGSPEESSEVYYLALLEHVGCTGAAPDLARWAGGDEIRFQSGAEVLGPLSDPSEDLRFLVRRLADDRPLPERVRLLAQMLVGGTKRVELMAANLCEGATLLARRLHMPDTVARALGQLMERWDGAGLPGHAAAEEISRPLRIVRVAHDLVAMADAHGGEAAAATLMRRRGHGYDPAIVDAALADPEALVRSAHAPDAWERVVAAEPEPAATVSRTELPSIARAFGEFTDVKIDFLHGHSTRVAALAGAAAEAAGCAPAEASEMRTAGFVHDLGRVAVPNGIWGTPGPLGVAEWERVRLHPYYTERVLERTGALAPLALTCGSHHERLDGSGYHRGAVAAQLTLGARLLAAADAFDAMTHDRPHRAALRPGDARAELAEMVQAGRLDARAVNAVLEAAGAGTITVGPGHPAGLTGREVEVLRLIARGRTSKEIARALVITEKTVGHHVEHIYAKTGVTTRVGAALFAMRHDLAG